MAELPSDGFLAPELQGRANSIKGGLGVYAIERVAKGSVLGVWGGSAVDLQTLMRMPPGTPSRSVQVEDDCYLVSDTRDEPVDFFNHSCEPNAGMADHVVLVAMREIQPGEEVCFDYAMTDGSAYDEFECRCGAASCRGVVTGNDWMITRLQHRYLGYFSPYLQRRIVRWHAARVAAAAEAQPAHADVRPSAGGMPARSARSRNNGRAS